MRCSWPPGNSVTWLNFRYRTIIGRGSCPLLDGGRFAFAYKRERGCSRPGVSARVGKRAGAWPILRHRLHDASMARATG